MKVTIEIEDALHSEAKAFARANKTTLRELIESGLRREVEASAEESQKPRARGRVS